MLTQVLIKRPPPPNDVELHTMLRSPDSTVSVVLDRFHVPNTGGFLSQEATLGCRAVAGVTAGP